MTYKNQDSIKNNTALNVDHNDWVPLTISINEEIKLEQLKPEHIDPIFKLVQNNKKHLSKWLGWVNNTKSAEDTKGFITNTQEEYKQHKTVVYVIKRFQHIVGLVDLHEINQSTKTACLGYWLEQSSTGKGIITLCCQTLIDYAFSKLLCNQIKIRCARENYLSSNVAKRLGFTYLGTEKNAEELNGFWIDLDVYVSESPKKF